MLEGLALDCEVLMGIELFGAAMLEGLDVGRLRGIGVGFPMFVVTVTPFWAKGPLAAGAGWNLLVTVLATGSPEAPMSTRAFVWNGFLLPAVEGLVTVVLFSLAAPVCVGCGMSVGAVGEVGVVRKGFLGLGATSGCPC